MPQAVQTNDLIAKVLSGELRAIARAISLVENNAVAAPALLKGLFPATGKALVIGITGAPGSGKSTLVDQLALEWRARGCSVAIVAVDPSSPFSGGAVLGDRIRMAQAAEDSSIFIRSIATRGALGGLSKAASDVVHILDAAGFDIVLVETVGVGQAEVDIVRLADSCVVVMVPGMGDSVQAIKAGVLEIADIFVVNKSDKDGADMVQKDIRSMLSLVTTAGDAWEPEIIATVATTGKGSKAVVDALKKHRKWLDASGAGKLRQRQIMQEAILQRVKFFAEEKALQHKKLPALVERCQARKSNPFEAARELLEDAE